MNDNEAERHQLLDADELGRAVLVLEERGYTELAEELIRVAGDLGGAGSIPTEVLDPVKMKLACVARHAEQLLEDGHPFDLVAVRSLLADADVQAYMQGLDAQALLPVKR